MPQLQDSPALTLWMSFSRLLEARLLEGNQNSWCIDRCCGHSSPSQCLHSSHSLRRLRICNCKQCSLLLSNCLSLAPCALHCCIYTDTSSHSLPLLIVKPWMPKPTVGCSHLRNLPAQEQPLRERFNRFKFRIFVKEDGITIQTS